MGPAEEHAHGGLLGQVMFCQCFTHFHSVLVSLVGLISDYYIPRWTHWVEAVSTAMSSHKQFNETTWISEIEDWEEAWVHQQGNSFQQTSSGDAFALASAMYTKYIA